MKSTIIVIHKNGYKTLIRRVITRYKGTDSKTVAYSKSYIGYIYVDYLDMKNDIWIGLNVYQG